MEPNETDGSWDSCKMFVLRELRRMNDVLEKIDDKMSTVQIKVAGIAAAAAILVSVVVTLIAWAVKG